MVEDEFRGRVALVTGSAGQGIGRATAARLCAGGAHTVVTDVHPGRCGAGHRGARGGRTIGRSRHRQSARRERPFVDRQHGERSRRGAGSDPDPGPQRGLQRHGFDLQLPARGLDAGHGHQPERTVVPDQGRDVADEGRRWWCHRQRVERRARRRRQRRRRALRRQQGGAERSRPVMRARGWSPRHPLQHRDDGFRARHTLQRGAASRHGRDGGHRKSPGRAAPRRRHRRGRCLLGQ